MAGESDPRSDHLASLVEQTTGAGVRVEPVVVGEARELPRGIELSAYRIVQEALTNVVRHAHIRVAWVEIAYRDGELVIIAYRSGLAVAH